MKQKLLCLSLVLIMFLTFAAGCGQPSPDPVEPATSTDISTPTPTETAEPEETPAVESTPDPEIAAAEQHAKYAKAYAKYSPDTVVMHVNGIPVLWSEYFSWIYNIGTQLESYYDIENWSEACPDFMFLAEDPSYNGYANTYAATNCIQIITIRTKAEELGIGLSGDQEELVSGFYDRYVAQYESEEALEEALEQNFMSSDYFLTNYKTSILYDNLFAKTLGEDGANVPDEDAIQYVTERGYLYAKHILFSTLDDDRQPLEEAAAAEKKALAEQVFAQLKACAPAELPARFDELMQEYNEDPGMRSYPDGYYFLSGKMVAPFENSVKALEVNGLDLVETDYGYHIIYKPAMSADHLMEYDSQYIPYTVRSYAATALFSTMTYEWYDAAEVEYEPGFETLDLDTLFAD